MAGSVAGISAGTVVRVRVGRGAETMAVVTVGGTGAMAVGPSAIVGEIWSVSCLVQSNNDGYVPCPLRVA